jgi:hypothetical protein
MEDDTDEAVLNRIHNVSKKMSLNTVVLPNDEMTLDEAIKHVESVICNSTASDQCRQNHLQLLKWLLKLQGYEKYENSDSFKKREIDECCITNKILSDKIIRLNSIINNLYDMIDVYTKKRYDELNEINNLIKHKFDEIKYDKTQIKIVIDKMKARQNETVNTINLDDEDDDYGDDYEE